MANCGVVGYHQWHLRCLHNIDDRAGEGKGSVETTFNTSHAFVHMSVHVVVRTETVVTVHGVSPLLWITF